MTRDRKKIQIKCSRYFRTIKKIWHGSHAHGDLHKADHPCKNWKTDTPSRKATAASIVSYTPALNEEFVRCDKKLITLCIQTTLR